MSKFSPYAALCNIFRNSEAVEQPEVPDKNIEQSDKQVDTKSIAVNFDPKKISMINNSCQTQPLRDYSIDKVIPNYKQRQKTVPQPLGIKCSSKDDNFNILRPSYAAFTGEKPYIELQNNVRPSRRPKVPRTPKITIPRRTITPPKPAPPIEIAYNPLVNTSRIRPRRVITVDHSDFLSNSNLLTNQNSSKNCQEIFLNHQKQAMPINQNNFSILQNPNVHAVYKTVSALKEAIKNGNMCVDPDIYDKCICRDCGTLAVLSESLKHPISYEISPPYDNTHNKTCTEKPETAKNYSSNKKNRSRSRIIAEAYSILEGKLELMEHRLQELEILCQHYEKINANHSGLTFDIYTQCTHDDNDKYQINYENSEVSIQNTPNCDINFETSEINLKGCHFPLFNLPRNIADKFKKQKHGKTQVHHCPRHLEEQSIYMCRTVDQNLNPTNDKRNDTSEEKPKLRSHEYFESKKKQENTKMKRRSSKLSTASEANSVSDKLDNFDFNLFTEQEVRDLLIYIRERNTKKERFESSRKQASTQVLFRNKMKQPIRESTPNFILEETMGHLENFDENSTTTFQDHPTDSFQESSRQNFFLDSRIGDQHDPFDYVRFLNTKIQEKIYNENINSCTNKNFTPTVNALHKTNQFFRKNETVTLEKNNQSDFLKESNIDNMQLRGTKLRLNTPNNNFSNRVNLLHNPLHNSQLYGTKINLQTQPKNLCKKESIDIDSMMYKLNGEISYLFNKFHKTGSSKLSTKIKTMYTNNNLDSNSVSNASTFYSEFEIPEKLSSCNPVTSRTSADIQLSPFETENENFNLTKTARVSTDFTYHLSSAESKFESEAIQNSHALTNFTHYTDSKKPKLESDSSANTEIFTPKKILLQNSDRNTLNINHDEQKIRPIQCYKTTNQNISSQNTISTKVTKPYVSKIPKAITPKNITNTANNSESTKTEEEPLCNATTTSKSLNSSENECKSNNKTKCKAPLQKKTTTSTNKTLVKNSENSTVNDPTFDKPHVKTEQAEKNNVEFKKKLKILNKFDFNSKYKQTPKLSTAKKVKPSQPKKVFNQNTIPKLEDSEESRRAPKVEKQNKEEHKKKTSETKQKFVKKIRATLSKNYISSKTSIKKFFHKAKTSKIFFESKIPIRSFNRQVNNHITLEEKKNEDAVKKSVIPKKNSSKSEITTTSFYNDKIAVISEEPNSDIEILNRNNSKNDIFEIANIEQIVNINCVMFTIHTMLLNTIFPFEDSSDEEPIFTELVSQKNVNFTEFKPEENMEDLNNNTIVCNKRNPLKENVVLTVQTVILNNINPTVEKDEVCLFTNLKSAMNILLYQGSAHSDLSSAGIENTAELRPAYNTGNFVILNMSRHRISAFSGIPADIRQTVDSRSNLVIPYMTPRCDTDCSEHQFSFEDLHSDDSSDSYTERVRRRPPSFVKRLKRMFTNAFRKMEFDRRKHCHGTCV